MSISKVIKSYLFFVFSFFSNTLLASQVMLDEQVTLAVDRLLQLPNGASLSVILTEELKDKDGNRLRGPHDVLFTLSENSEFAVNIEGSTVAPGQTVRLVTNLSLSSSRLYLPIYPANKGDFGHIDYSIHLPSLSITDCPAQTTPLKNGGCAATEVQAGVYVCPQSYDLNGLECQLDETITIKSACPVGFAYLNGQCISSDVVSVRDACADGYILTSTGTVCEQTVQHPMVHTCPINFTIQPDTTCKQVETILPHETCPDTYTRNNEQCERTLKLAISDCESGYVLLNGQCYERQAASPVCPTGQQLVGDNCERVERIDSSVQCDDGFTMNPNGQCVKRSEQPLNGHACPEGTVTTDGGCARLSRYIQESKCPSGMTFNGEFCTEETVQDIIGCAEGWYMHDNGTCHELHDFELICEDGYSIHNNRCIKNETISATLGCPTGYSFDADSNLCSKTVVIDAAKSCVDDYALDGGQCTREISTPVESCQSGYLLKNDRCYQVKDITYVCPTGYSENAQGRCQQTDSVEKTWRCPDTYEWTGSVCQRTLEVDAQQSCALPGYSIVNGRCEKVTTADFVRCEDGYDLIAGECYQVTAKNTYCSDGYTLTADGSQCEKTASVESTQVCPDEWENMGTHCEWRDSYATEPVCPPFYELNNERCERFVSTAVEECQPGQIKNADDTCSTYHIIEPQCPENMTLRNGACYQQQEVLPERCESGYLFSQGTCHEIVSDEFSCPDGMSLTQIAGKSVCKQVQTIQNCPSGYGLNEQNQCVNGLGQVATEQHYCPPGTVWNAQGGAWGSCQVLDGETTYTDTVLACPDGYRVASEGECFTSCPEDAQRDANGQCVKYEYTLAKDSAVCLTGTMQYGDCWETYAQQIGTKGYQCAAGYRNTEHDSTLNDDVTTGHGRNCVKAIAVESVNYCTDDIGIQGGICVKEALLSNNLAKKCQPGAVMNEQGECHLLSEQAASCNSLPAQVDGAIIRSRHYDEQLGACVVTYEYEHHSRYQCPAGFQPVYPFTSSYVADLPQANSVFVGDNNVLFGVSGLQSDELMLGPDDQRQAIVGSANIKQYLCVADTIAYNYLYLGDHYEQTFDSVTSGTKGYLADESRNMLDDIQKRLSGNYEINGTYNPEYLLSKNTNPSQKRHLNVFPRSLSPAQQAVNSVTIPGWSQLHETTKAWPIIGNEDYLIYGVRLVAGKLPDSSNVNPASYIQQLPEGQTSAITLLPTCNSASTQELLQNMQIYNHAAYQGFTSDGKEILSFRGYSDAQSGEEKCLVQVRINASATTHQLRGYEALANGLSRSIKTQPQAELCDTLATPVFTRGCPLGMTLSEDQTSCVKKSSVAAQVDCGSGVYDPQQGMCILGAQCPDGYSRDGDQCVQLVSCETLTGRSGAFYDANKDACAVSVYDVDSGNEDIAHTPIICPNDADVFDPMSMTCQHLSLEGQSSAELYCDIGTLSGSNCLIEEHFGAIEVMQAGVYTYDQAHNQCIETKFVTPSVTEHYCDSGEPPHIVNGQLRCAVSPSVAQTLPPAICPQGYQADDAHLGRCSKVVLHPASTAYAEDVVMIDNLYVRSQGDETKLRCPLGAKSHNGRCIIEAQQNIDPFEYACPAGMHNYNLSDDNGIMMPVCIDADVQPVCEAGWELGTEPFACNRIEIHPLHKQCDEDYGVEGYQCKQVATQPIDYQCPTQFTLSTDNLWCTRHITQPKSQPCNDGAVERDAENCRLLTEDDTMGICAHGYQYDIASDSCRQSLIEPIVYSCDADRTLNPPMCDKYEVAGRIFSCPENYTEQGDGSCLLIDYTPKVEQCEAGFAVSDGQCTAVEPSTSVAQCGAGFNYDADADMCKKTQTQAHIYSCEDGYDLKNGTECHRLDQLFAQYQCYGADQLTGAEKCERTDVTHSDTSCPSGYTWDSSQNRCEKLTSVESTGCADGFRDENGQCRQFGLYNYSCPTGFTMNGNGLCESDATHTPNKRCPDGYFNDNGTCFSVESAPASKACPSGWYIKDGICKTTLFEQVISCPSGYQLYNGTCRATTGVIYSCPFGYTLYGTTCYKDESMSATPNCPSGYFYNGSRCQRDESMGAT